MIKHSIRFVSVVLALFTFILIFQHTMSEQQQLPFGTTAQFEVNISKTSTPKEKLIKGLNELTVRNEGVLVKVATDTENYKNKNDVIWFGSKEPEPQNVIVDDEKIEWLDSKLTGELVSSSDIGARPIYGMYAMGGGHNFKSEINQWANENDIKISWVPQAPMLKSAYNHMIHTGIGNSITTAFLLFLTTLIGWFVTHAKARAIRLLGGVSRRRIHTEDTISIIAIVGSGFLLAWIMMLAYIIFVNGMKQLLLILPQSFIALMLLLLVSSVFTGVISILVSPKMEHMARRKIPLKRFRKLGILSIILALLIVPSTLASAYILQQLSKEYAMWENVKSSVGLSFGDLDSLETEQMLPEVEQFFRKMEEQKNLKLSLALDKAILLEKEEYGGYDHIIVTDRAWVDSLDIGVMRQGQGGKLSEINFGTIAEPLQKFLSAQMPLMVNTNKIQSEGMGFYEFEGDKFLALPPNVGYGGSTIQAKNPLIILIDSPVSTLETKGFMIPAASSRNVIFSNEEMLRLALSQSPMMEYVLSIDTIADVALQQAQKFEKQAIFYIMACVLIFVAMAFGGIMNAQLWAGSNKKRIFTLRTFGKSYYLIMLPVLKKELLVAILTVSAGCIITFLIRYPDLITLLGVAVLIGLLYTMGNLIALQVCVRQAFYQVSRRND